MNYRIAEDTKLIRGMLDMSQDMLAYAIGVSKQTIIRIENSEIYPNPETIEKIYGFAYKNNIKVNFIKEMLYKEDLRDEKLIFHGSKSFIEGDISLSFSRDGNDFGKGFYCGESIDQAVSFIARYPNSCVYIISFDNESLIEARFEVDQEWMLAIAYYRGMLDRYKDSAIVKNIIKKIEEADYVSAPIADNRMFRIIEQFTYGLITDEQCAHCLAATNLGRQYVLLNDTAISRTKILEQCYLCEAEKQHYLEIHKEDLLDGDNKVRAAMIKYKNQGRYIEEILNEEKR